MNKVENNIKKPLRRRPKGRSMSITIEKQIKLLDELNEVLELFIEDTSLNVTQTLKGKSISRNAFYRALPKLRRYQDYLGTQKIFDNQEPIPEPETTNE